MAWTLRTAGTASNGNNATSLTPGLPASFAAGDLHICVFQCFGGTNSRVPSMDSNWTELASITNGTSRHYAWYRIAQTGDTTPTITLTGTGVTGDTQLSQIHGFRPTSGKVPKLSVVGTESTNASADSVGPITELTANAGELGILTCGKSNDWNGTATLASWSLSAQNESTTGNDAGCALLYILSMSSGATGNLTVTDNGGTASNGVGCGMLNTFKEIFELTTGVASETDTALQSGRAKPTGLGTETDSSLTLSLVRIYAIGVASETDSALAPTVAIVATPGLYLPLGFYWASEQAAIVTTGIAAETDTSFGLGRIKFYATGVASETDSSQTLASVKLRSVTVSSETDEAVTLAHIKILSIGIAAETDSSLNLSQTKIRAIGIGAETDTSLALDLVTGLSTGVSTEVDTSLGLGRNKLYAYTASNEADSAYSLGRIKVYAAAIASETDTALAPTVITTAAVPGFYFPLRFNLGAIFVQPPVQLAVETDEALALVRTKFYNVQLAVENDVALNLGVGDPGFYLPFGFYIGVPGGAKLITTGRAEETDVALSFTLVRSPQKLMVRWAEETAVVSAVTYRKGVTVGIAESVEFSVACSVAHVRDYGIASETDTAFGPPLGIVGQVGVATEVDTALPLVRIQAVTVKAALETDNALALIAPRAVDVGVAVEIDTALLLETNFARGVSAALELDQALPRKILHVVSTQSAESINEALNLARTRIVSTKLSQSFNTAFSVVRTKKKATGIAVEVDAAKGTLVRSYTSREYDNALFFEIKKNGVVVFPIVATSGEKRMWTGFIS